MRFVVCNLCFTRFPISVKFFKCVLYKGGLPGEVIICIHFFLQNVLHNNFSECVIAAGVKCYFCFVKSVLKCVNNVHSKIYEYTGNGTVKIIEQCLLSNQIALSILYSFPELLLTLRLTFYKTENAEHAIVRMRCKAVGHVS